MKRLNKLSLENFRIFSGKTNFAFNDLNIFTGANNSGKSTVIKAVNFFSEGLKTTDFPSLNLFSEDLNLGKFEDNLNRDSNKRTFRIGLPVQINGIEEDFNVIYTFGEGYDKSDDKFKEYAIFSDLSLFDSSGALFFQMHSQEAETDGRIENFIETPYENSDPGLLDFRLNLKLLEKYLPKIAGNSRKYDTLLSQMWKISSNDGFWWGECFGENEFFHVDYDLSKFNLKDFERELAYDLYVNMGDFATRKAVFIDRDEEATKSYSRLIKEVFYHDFILDFFRPLLTSVSQSLNLLRDANIIHITPEILRSRLIPANEHTGYLQVIYRSQQDGAKFIHEALKIFGIDGLTEIINHLNTSFELNLITGVADSIQNRKTIVYDGMEIQPLFQVDYDILKSNQRINLSDLGKGASNIVLLILKIASIAINLKKEKSQKEDLPEIQGRHPEKIVRKTVLIEEPEAFLHPNWQSKLADLFLYCINEYGIQLIIETHSTYLIQRLQYLVAKKEIDPERINLLYFNQGSEVEKYYKINIRKDGILKESFGTGFYDETANLTAAILNSQNLN
jgi:energy-coupling factor transporter ATP-binding protein EcfA2